MGAGAVVAIDASGNMAVPAPPWAAILKTPNKAMGPRPDRLELLGCRDGLSRALLEPGGRYHSGGNTAQSVPEQTISVAQTGTSVRTCGGQASTQPGSKQRLFDAAAFTLQQPLILGNKKKRLDVTMLISLFATLALSFGPQF